MRFSNRTTQDMNSGDQLMRFTSLSTQVRLSRRTTGALLLAMLVLAGAPLHAAEAVESPDAQKQKADTQKQLADSQKSAAETQKKLDDAQRRLDQAAHEVAELSMALAEQHGYGPTMMRTHGHNHAVLGINIGGESEPVDGGVKIASVSPGGAADAAGIRAGDVLTEINGNALKRDGDTSAREKLLSNMRGVKPGDKVAISYRRDGKVAKAELVATQPSFEEGFPALPAIAAMPEIRLISRRGFGRMEGVFGSTELVTLTPKLGQYFGADKGLLVVRAPNDSQLKLEEGDVLLDIDGRVPTNPGHAFRILGSYQSGEKVKLGVLRQKKRMNVEVTIPEERAPRPGEEFPVPPVPPAPVVLPAPPTAAIAPTFSSDAT
jgi:PDZ domain